MTSSDKVFVNCGYGELAPSALISMPADAISAAVSHLVRDWGDYGYFVRGFTPLGSSCWIANYGASDGSYFGALVDRYGNVRDIPESATKADVLAMARELVSA